MPIRPLFTLIVAVLLTASVQGEHFVRTGKPVLVAESSGGWTSDGGFFVGEGAGSKLIAGQQIGPGDFEIKAELALEKLARSAAVFRMGGSYFGFEGAHGKIFLTGALFDDARGTPIGEPDEFMADGRLFVFQALRRGKKIRFLIDGRLVHERDIHAGALGEVGLMPGRARMKVKHFSATGTLGDKFEIPLYPPYRIKPVAGVEKIRLLPPGPGNARNSEGDFIRLKDGRVLFVYTHFTGGGSDHAAGHLAGRFSRDGGQTWTQEDKVIVPQSGGFNDMSVSLLRLQDGRIALFYVRKNSLLDCRPVMRVSSDEAETWSEPIECITDQIGYYVLNNDRVIQLRDGRLIMAVALHNLPSYSQPNWKGHVMCYYSDDAGQTWKRNRTILEPKRPDGRRLIAQEPGLIELKDGRLMMFIRSDAGAQLVSYSKDRGETWSEAVKSTLQSPVSPATIERIPSTGDLLVAWNNHENVDERRRGKRTPFNVAISRDEGKTWGNVRTLEDDPNGWYCYTAMEFVDDHVLLGHCAGDRRTGGLNLTQVTRFPVDWLYQLPELDSVRQKLNSGQPVNLVCFGDSVTGVYYHTGGRRAYTDMLGIALKQIYPAARIKLFNAGISGHTTANAIARIERDVLAWEPDLVTIMFGLNDMTRVSLKDFEANLRQIAGRIRAAGSAVILCTPNAVTTTKARPIEKLAIYCDVVRKVAREENIPLGDSHREFEQWRSRDSDAWRLTMSDAIHPNMGGHKKIAEQLAFTISDRRTSLDDIGPPADPLAHTKALLAQNKPIKLLAMPPLDSLARVALPNAKLDVVHWDSAGKTLPELRTEAARLVRKSRPDLVLLTFPRSAEAKSREEFIDAGFWLMNHSLSFGKSEWDCVVVHPSVVAGASGQHDRLIRTLVANHDLPLIDRREDDTRDMREILTDEFTRWLR